MSIHVNDFQWIPGKNDAEYIKLLESSRDEWQKIAQKAISKLKTLSKAQQEPRVMTLEEVIALKENTPVYIENWNGYHGWDVYVGIDPVDNDITTGAPWSPSEYWPQSTYLYAWRCWTSCPTKEQMEETPWND